MQLAVTHRSWCAEHDGEPSNERLEFLGDAVVGLAVAEHLHERFPDMAEGQLAKIRAEVVSAPALAEAAQRLSLGELLRLGKGERSSGGHEKQSILSDALEAVVGALFLRDGWAEARALVLEVLMDRIDTACEGPGEADYKTRLQELAAQRGGGAPAYEISSTGPDHDKRFGARVEIDGEEVGSGVGRSKKEAEQQAAERAWHELTEFARAQHDRNSSNDRKAPDA